MVTPAQFAEALRMEGLLAPVQATLTRVLGFLPNLIGTVLLALRHKLVSPV